MCMHTCEESTHTHEVDLENNDGQASCADASLSSQEDRKRKVPGACSETSMAYLGSYGSVREILSKINNMGGS